MKRKLYQIIFILIIFLIGCILLFDKKEESNLKKIKVSEVAHSIFYAPQYVAIHNNYFKEEGLEIELLLGNGADKVVASVLSGDVDIGFSGSEATIYVYNGGEKDYLKTFARLTQKDGSFIVSREKKDHFTLDDLKGKYYIAGRIGGMPYMTLKYLLNQNGIQDDDLTLDTSIAFSSMASSFIGGVGDYVSLFEPTATEVAKQGYGYIVASLGELGGNVPYTSYSARTSFLEKNPDIIKKFNNAILKGLNYVNTHTAEEIAEIIKVEFPNTDMKDLINAIKQYKSVNTWPETTEFSKESFDHMQDIMINAKEITNKVNYDDLIYIIK